MEKRNNRLLNAKLNKYIIPGIMMSLALQLGNIVDTIFVSNFIGVEAMSAVTMSLPVETIVQLTGYCLGVGGSIAVGNMLGKRDKESASKLFTATFAVTLVIGILFSICVFCSRPDFQTSGVWKWSPDNLHKRLYPYQYVWSTGNWTWSFDGKLPWSGKSSGTCICVSDFSKCDKPGTGLHIPQIYFSWNLRCVFINSTRLFTGYGGFCPLYSF